MKVRFYRSAADFRRWLATNHARARELWVGFFRKDSGRGGLTYPEALDEALCHGWIDGVRQRVDAVSYTIRFTRRRPKSLWSRVNLRHVARLRASGRMRPAGLAVFTSRNLARSGRSSSENAPCPLAPADERRFAAQRRAWTFFQAQPPGYRKVAIWWVVSAKKDETRARRLTRLIADSAEGRRLGQITGSRSEHRATVKP
jgi:uncharacterized protein YdeI (YjbR/CyaY-like superfamily)